MKPELLQRLIKILSAGGKGIKNDDANAGTRLTLGYQSSACNMETYGT
jgi:hypothetical protein